jgi:hypothetical protein
MEEYPVRIKAGLRQRRRKEVRTRDAPEDLAGRSGGNTGGEKDGGCAVYRVGGAAGDLVQRSEDEAVAGQGVVRGADAKRQALRAGALCADAAHVIPELAQQRLVPHVGLPKSS